MMTIIMPHPGSNSKDGGGPRVQDVGSLSRLCMKAAPSLNVLNEGEERPAQGLLSRGAEG